MNCTVLVSFVAHTHKWNSKKSVSFPEQTAHLNIQWIACYMVNDLYASLDPLATQIQFKSNQTHVVKSQVPQLSNSFYNMMQEDKSVIQV